MILQCDLRGTLQPCYHQYCESLILNQSNNNYYINLGDILALALLGETLYLLNFLHYQSGLQRIDMFYLLTFYIH